MGAIKPKLIRCLTFWVRVVQLSDGLMGRPGLSGGGVVLVKVTMVLKFGKIVVSSAFDMVVIVVTAMDSSSTLTVVGMVVGAGVTTSVDGICFGSRCFG